MLTDLTIFKNRKPGIIGKLKVSSVNILIAENNGEDCLVFERRASTLRSQPSDISLPGGRCDEGESPFDTAKRELFEELGIEVENVEYFGENDLFISTYSQIVHSFVGRIINPDFKVNKDEVDEVILIPLTFFLENEPDVFYMKIRPEPSDDFPFDRIVNGKNYKFSNGEIPQYFYSYKNTNIWGITARMVKNFLDILGKK